MKLLILHNFENLFYKKKFVCTGFFFKDNKEAWKSCKKEKRCKKIIMQLDAKINVLKRATQKYIDKLDNSLKW